MPGPLVLLVLVLISSSPVIAVYAWFRLANYQISLTRFLFALLAGAAAFFPALILQNLLTFSFATQGRTAVLYNFFIRVAFTEELSRLLMLFIFFFISGRVKPDEDLSRPLTFNIIKKGTAIGLVAGLGFAILESARYAAADMSISIVLLRFFTAALHGACGSRVGAAAVMFRTNPFQALMRLLTAVAIHGIFNFMASLSGLPSLMAILIALSAAASSIMTIHSGWNNEEDPQPTP
ncbi:MAG: PrsW family intramembrane metalloprotease [Treponema sp.]|jgi:RsiW-degrading membrane proteinase PrsW (M82 family)|nr:PrsW family intramembrane metalloprotease [Treponema sp.]